MNDEKTNCCDTINSDCNTQEVNCCSTEQKFISNKKIAGLGIFFIAIIFAVVSAFTKDNTDLNAKCNTGEISCETSCETGSEETSCCLKK